MIAEIFEQPKAVAETLAKSFGDARRVVEQLDLQKLGMVYFTGSGTSYHACLAANYALSTLTRVLASSLPASEFPSWVRQPHREETVLVAISQSGESSDVMSAVDSARRSGMRVVAVTNTPQSNLAKSTKLQMIANAGEEKAVTATKSFSATLAATYALVLELARASGATSQSYDELASELGKVPGRMEETLRLCDNACKTLASELKEKEFVFLLGSGPNHFTALEGALKLKESCNVYAEGFATREFLHGPTQLVDKRTPVFIIEGQGESEQAYRLVESFMRFGAPTVVIREKSEAAPSKGMVTLEVAPDVAEVFSPLVYVVPLQLYAYYSSVMRGLNPDRPEKLRKVVK
jgi:glucosamine--fructose-6-phosphate aminotransferase (isomerizing)